MLDNPIEIVVSPQRLAGVLQHLLGNQAVAVREWETLRLQGGLESNSSIYRLQGGAAVDEEVQSWSVILKIIRPEAAFDDPQGYQFWKREIQYYQSGMLQDLPGQVSAPVCYAVDEQADGSVWLWLENIEDTQEHPWSIERYSQVARRLGQFNGAYLVDRSLPDAPWITHDWLQKYLDHAAPMVEFLLQNPKHPTVQSLLPGISLPLSLALWKERTYLLRVLDRLPQVFCHQDAFERNLFDRDGQVIAIDWGFAGIAPLGAELAPLVGVAFGLGKFPASQAKELDQACFEAYLGGLRQAGWQPDARQVRLGYTLTVLLRYVLGATIGELLPGLLDERTRHHWVEGLGTTEKKAAETDPGIVVYYQAISLEALKLLGLGSMVRVIGNIIGYAIRLAGKSRGDGGSAV